MDCATRQHISSGVSRTSSPLRVRYRSRSMGGAGSVHFPTFGGRVSDGILPLLPALVTAATRRRGGLHPGSHRRSATPILCGEGQGSTPDLGVVKQKDIHKPSTGYPPRAVLVNEFTTLP